MPTSSFTKYQDFAEQLGKKNHNLNADTLKIALTNAAPNAATHVQLSDITQISTGGGYTGGAGGGLTLAGVGYTETGGVGSLVATDNVFTASGGSVGPFRYAVLYNDTTTSPADALIGYWDYGSSITLADGESFTLDFGATILTIT
ncbi:hypothetical protein HQ945_08395 [Phyllobacterium sp. BT25]|uniref:Uncharacterized protein n=1 Tax=Phyllobacterium pellucidum TaxID=2740464 RepID=A0A849VTT9_9HYPH|nr:hypothetical protein [Phyllobacterium pellucidum]NTS31273.1 hypothetical protein [Phyllobacterium pellucidum]